MINTVLKSLLTLVAGPFQKKYKVIQAKDEPTLIVPKIVYLVGESDFFAYALLICPCGCKNKIYLNLILGSKPVWKVLVEDKIPTISPSGWGESGCKSHFFIHSGKVIWA